MKPINDHLRISTNSLSRPLMLVYNYKLLFISYLRKTFDTHSFGVVVHILTSQGELISRMLILNKTV